MKLLGRDFAAEDVVRRIEERLAGRKVMEARAEPIDFAAPEPRVDPVAFHLEGMDRNADSTRPLPLHTHRSGAGRLVLVAKWGFRKCCQVLINEALGRQRVFNGHVRDAYALLSADVTRLQTEMDALRASPTKAKGGPRHPKRVTGRSRE